MPAALPATGVPIPRLEPEVAAAVEAAEAAEAARPDRGARQAQTTTPGVK